MVVNTVSIPPSPYVLAGAMALDNGQAVVFLNKTIGGSEQEIYAQRYDYMGNKVGSEIFLFYGHAA